MNTHGSEIHRVVILHGSGGSPDGNWFPWLKSQLEGLGHEVVVPALPGQHEQSLESWSRAFREQVVSLRESDIVIGHSTGAGFALNLLNDSPIPVRGTMLVAGFLGELGHPVFDPVNASFFEAVFRWKKIRENAGTTRLYAGDDDPYVPLSKTEDLAVLLDAPLTVIAGGGHLNAKSGFTTFDALLTDFELTY